MPESMFGRPSQHLLPQNPPANAGGAPAASGSQTTPVQPTPPTFRDFRFNSIGKPPELLSRISVPQPENFSYHSSSPSPISTPPPATNDDVFPSKLSSRPTLLQQLAGWDFNDAGESSSHTSPNQMNGSLAARIQMDTNSANNALSGGFLPHLSHLDAMGTTENDNIGHFNLIPPIEFLPSGPDSTAPTPTTPALSIPQPVLSHRSESFNPVIGTDNSGTVGTELFNPSGSRGSTDVNASASASHPEPVTTVSHPIPASTVNSPPAPISTTASSRTLPQASASFSEVDAIMRDLDPLVDRQARLTAIKANLTNLALPPPPPSSLSASPVPSTISRTNNNVGLAGHSQPQQDPGLIALHLPYPVDNRQPDRPSLSSNGVSIDTDSNALALVTSSSTLSHEYQTQRKAIGEAARSLNIAFNTAYRAQLDSEVALTARMQALENEHAAFEEKKRADELALQNQLREIQQKREELSAKEVAFVAMEKESKARELMRRAMLEKRQALDEERRVADEKRIQEVQEQIATALKELQELEALREEKQRLQQEIDSTPDMQLIEPEEGMSAEEGAVIKSRNGLVPSIKHHRQMHTEKLQKFGELDRTVRRLAEERQKREAEEVAEAERRRVEEDRLRANAEAERARQVLEQERREREEVETESRRREAIKADERRRSAEGHVTFGRARLLVEQQALAEAQVHGVRQTESQEVEQRRHQGISPSQQQNAAEAFRMRATRQESSLAPPEPPDAMDVDEADRAVSPNHTVRSPTIHSTKGGSRKTPSKSKKKTLSGGVMLSVSSRADGAHLPPKPMAASSHAPSSSDIATGCSSNVGRAPSSPPSTDSGDAETFTFPAQLASEFNHLAGAVNGAEPATHRPSTPEQKPFFWAPKSQTLLEAGLLGVGNGASQTLNIGPRLVVSPTQRDANLRHLKRARGRIEENEGGDRSVRIASVKPEDVAPPWKREEHDEQSQECVQASSANPLASLPPRSHVIPPPRPRRKHRKRRDGDPSQPSSSQPSATSEPHDLPFTGEASEVTTKAQPGNVPPRASPSSQMVGVSARLPVPPMNSLLLAPVHWDPQSIEYNSHANERPAQDRVTVPETTSPETISTTFPHETEGQDPSRNNRRSSDEHRPGRNGSNLRRQFDHYSSQYGPSHPAMPPPPQFRRPVGDSWLPLNADAPRAEPMRASSPTTGRKRPSDSNNNENAHRSRRQRPDVWIADDLDRERRGDSYHPRERRSLNTEPDEHRSSYRTPPSPDPSRVYLSEPQRGYDRYGPWTSDVSMAPPARYEQSYRRPETEEPRHQPAPPPTTTSYYPMADQYRPNDNRVGSTYEPPEEDRMDVHQDPSLLARISDTQRFQISAHSRIRGRGDPSRGRGDPARGRGRGNGRGGAGLLGRLTSGPSSLGDRLT